MLTNEEHEICILKKVFWSRHPDHLTSLPLARRNFSSVKNKQTAPKSYLLARICAEVALDGAVFKLLAIN
jgi:hypothetical protein